MAAEIPIVVKSKRVPWIDDLPVEGPDYTGAAFKMELRAAPGDTGAAIVTLTKQTAGTEGISATYDPAYVDSETQEEFAATVLVFQIDETTMEGLPTASPTDDAIALHYDVHVTPSGGTKFLLCYGTFTYSPGVTL